MASARKTYTRTKPSHLIAPPTREAERTAFINDLLDGTVRASTVVELANGRLEYDDPQGAAGAARKIR